MSTTEARMADEQLRAARDERYRTNVEFLITQARRLVTLIALVWVVTSGDVRSAACEGGPAWGARDAIVGACDEPQQSRSSGPPPRPSLERGERPR